MAERIGGTAWPGSDSAPIRRPLPERWEDLSRGQQWWVAISFVASAACWWYYVGPFQWLSDVWMLLAGSPSPYFPLAITYVAFWAAGHFLLRDVPPARTQAGDTTYWSLHRIWILAIPASMTAIGLYLHSQAGTMRQASMPVADLEDGRTPLSHWLTMTGAKAQADGALCIKHDDCYTPLVSSKWRAGDAIAVVLYSRGIPSTTLDTFDGVVSYRGVPGHIRAIAARSHMAWTRSSILVEWGRGPRDIRRQGVALVIAGGITWVIGAVALCLSYLSARVAREAAATKSRAH